MAIWTSLSRSCGDDRRALRELTQVVVENAALIERTWNEYFA
jgi:hypothetical protein